MGFHLPTRDSISVKNIGLFGSIGAFLGGADGAAFADLQTATIFAIGGGLIGAIIGFFVGKW